MTDKAVEKLKAKLEVANAALQNAIQRTINENLHLADGDVCTLIHLKRAIAT